MSLTRQPRDRTFLAVPLPMNTFPRAHIFSLGAAFNGRYRTGLKLILLTMGSLILLMNGTLRAVQATWVHYGPNGNLSYYTDGMGNKIPDFSYAGYMGGGVSLPVAPVEETISPVAGDNTSNNQNAINAVGRMTANS